MYTRCRISVRTNIRRRENAEKTGVGGIDRYAALCLSLSFSLSSVRPETPSRNKPARGEDIGRRDAATLMIIYAKIRLARRLVDFLSGRRTVSLSLSTSFPNFHFQNVWFIHIMRFLRQYWLICNVVVLATNENPVTHCILRHWGRQTDSIFSGWIYFAWYCRTRDIYWSYSEPQ